MQDPCAVVLPTVAAVLALLSLGMLLRVVRRRRVRRVGPGSRRSSARDRPLAEVRAFVENRLPTMPELTTADAWRSEADRLREPTSWRRSSSAARRHRWHDAETQVEWLDTIEGGPGYRIKKLRYEALPGLWVPALLYEPTELDGKVPVVLNVNGHDAERQGGRLQAGPLHQPGEAGDARPERRVVRHGPAPHAGEPARPDQRHRPLRHERDRHPLPRT